MSFFGPVGAAPVDWEDAPVDSPWDWLGRPQPRGGLPTDSDELGRQCFAGNVCSWEFTYGHRYAGGMLVHISHTTSPAGAPLPAPVAQIRYELWLPT
ncbi:hypothetical protein ACFY2R_26935 [Micromonospora olivasterospora]